MPLALNMDIPRAITNGLRRRGVDVLTAQEDGTAELDDPPLLDRATESTARSTRRMMTCSPRRAAARGRTRLSPG